MEQIHNQPIKALNESLTRREHEILLLLAQGLSRPEIAEKLTITLNSVKWHIQHLYGKLGVNRKHQALVCAAELGLLPTTSSARAAAPEPGLGLQPLPLQLTSLIGREKEIIKISRLLTLTEVVGNGKIRLALQVPAGVADDFREGVWLTELASQIDPEPCDLFLIVCILPNRALP